MEKDKKEAVLIVIFIGQDNYVHCINIEKLFFCLIYGKKLSAPPHPSPKN